MQVKFIEIKKNGDVEIDELLVEVVKGVIHLKGLPIAARTFLIKESSTVQWFGSIIGDDPIRVEFFWNLPFEGDQVIGLKEPFDHVEESAEANGTYDIFAWVRHLEQHFAVILSKVTNF